MTTGEPSNVQWHRTSPVAVVFHLFHTAREIATNALPALVIVAAAFASGGSGRKALMVSAGVFLVAASVVGSVLSWLRFRFCITGNRVRVRSGVFRREELSVEFGRIQNVSLREPFYMRPFGLAVLGIDTAGSKQKEILLGGIGKDLAIRIREQILATEGLNPEEREEAGREDDAPLLVSKDLGDIVIYGLTVNFILWFAVAVGAVLGAGDATEQAFEWLAAHSDLVKQAIAAHDQAGLQERLFWSLGLAVAFILLLPLVSVLGAVFRHHGYQLRANGETYRRNGGLLTRHEESLKRHKVQAAVLKQNFVARLFGRTNLLLRVASAGSGVETGQVALPGKSSFMVPALRAAEVAGLTAEFLPGCEVDSARYSRTDLRRLLTVVLSFTALIVAAPTASLSLLINWKFIAILPLALGTAGLLAYRHWLQAGYAVVGAHGYVRRGFFGTATTAFPLFKVQRVDITQSPGMRRRGLAHLQLHLASHSLTVHFIRVGDAERFRDLALYHAESSRQTWY